MGYFSTYTDKYLQITTLSHLYTHKLTSNYIKPHLNTLEHLSLHVWNILTCRYMWDKSYIPLHSPTSREIPYTNLHAPTCRTFDYIPPHPPTCKEVWDMYGNVDRCTNLHTCTYMHLHVGKGKKLRTSPYTPLQLLNTDAYPSLIFFTALFIMGWGLLFSYP